MNRDNPFFQNEITVGADPELFVRGPDGYISGHTFECGTKAAPQQTPHGSVQVDGLALECNVTPSKTANEFIFNLDGVIEDLSEIVKIRGFELVPVPTVQFGKKYISSLPKEVQALGCNPDFNAYTMEENVPPNANLPFRTGSGHIHIGWRKPTTIDYDHFTFCGYLTRELDYYLGLPSLRWDNDKQRRRMYGKAGAFRPKPYGVEYRVLSNAWLNEPHLPSYVFEQTMLCCQRIKEGRLFQKVYKDIAKKYINSNGRTKLPAQIWDEIHAV